MKIGAIYPQIELGGNPLAVNKIGLAIEQLGYDHLLMYDHVIGATHDRTPKLWGPYTDQDPFHDPLIVFAYLAGITKKIELVTGVLILPQRQTALVAQQCADLDLLSNERLRLCVGVGWNYVEYDSLGQNFKTRGKRLSEQIPLLRRLWQEPLLSFEGEFDHFDRACINPRPNRQIPIYCGGFSEPAFKRAAKLADGFLFAADQSSALNGWQKLQSYLAENNRTADGFGAEYIVQNEFGKGLSTTETVDAIRRWQDAGGSHASALSMGLGYTTIEQHINHYAEIQYKLGKTD